MRLVRVRLSLLACSLVLGACGGAGGGGGTPGGGPGPGPGPRPEPTTADQLYNLDRVNTYRSLVGATLFTTDGFIGSAAENQGDPNGWPPAGSIQAQIDQILLAMWNEDPGSGSSHGHYNNMANPIFHRLGVGFHVDGNGRLYFTNDFSM